MIITEKKDLTPQEKTEKINLHRLYHTPLLTEYQVPDKDFNVKMVFSDLGQKVIGVFPGEFKKQGGFYIEFVDRNLDPTDPKRTVYRLSPRDNYESVFNLLKSGSYAVPITELEEVVSKKVEIQEEQFIDLPKSTSTTDENQSKMTIKDHAAIVWRLPISDKIWLNDLINEMKKQGII